jgi:hypothetical protein
LVAYEVRQLITTSIKRAHIAPQVVHQDFRRVRATLQHHFRVFIALVVALICHGVHEPLHDSHVFDVVVFAHHFFVHIDLLTKKTGFFHGSGS